jgi:cell wall assembly regulator SMI1
VRQLADHLARLEDALRSASAVVASRFAPGLTKPSVDRLLASLGLAPSPELLTWLAWHDGADWPGVTSSWEICLVPGAEFYDAGFLRDECLTIRGIASTLASNPQFVFKEHELWGPSWFPIFRLVGKGYVAADLASPGTTATPIHIVWNDSGPTERARVAWPSLTEFAAAAVRNFEAGTFTVDSEGIVVGPDIDQWPD